MTIKYRVHEVSKDLNIPSKEIIDLLANYSDTPKKHMTALTDGELNIVFDYFTQHNQVESFDPFFADNKKPEPKPEPPVKAEKKEEKPQPAAKAPEQAKPVQKKDETDRQKPQQSSPAKQQAAPQKPAQQENRPQEKFNFPVRPPKSEKPKQEQPKKEKTVRHVDTRAAQVDLDADPSEQR